jgi:hypothetical protein
MYTLYPVTTDPPSTAGAFHDTVIELLDDVSLIGAAGASGTSAQAKYEMSDDTEEPIAFTASM